MGVVLVDWSHAKEAKKICIIYVSRGYYFIVLYDLVLAPLACCGDDPG